MKRILLAFIVVLLATTFALADTVYLRDGRVVRGTVIGFIGGRFAVRVSNTSGTSTATTTNTARTNDAAEQGEIQFFRPRDIDRVEIEGRSLEEARFETKTVEVALGPNWIDTGVDLRRNERVNVSASGTIVAGRTRITPSGLRSTDPNAPLPRAAEGVLIGAITDDPNAPIIEIGVGREFVADRDGRLYLTVNRTSYTDARGSFTARVRAERDFPPLRRDNSASNRDTINRNENEDDSVFGNSQRTTPAPTRPRNPSSSSSSTSSRDPFGTPRDQSNTTRDGDPDRRTPGDVTVNVPGNSQGTDTGVDLRVGDQVSVSATGTIVAGQRAGSVAPNGKQSGAGAFFGNPRYPFPQAGAGALIGFIRNTAGSQSPVFLVGSQLVFTSQVDGRLFLLVNDDDYSDNSGQFSVRIRY